MLDISDLLCVWIDADSCPRGVRSILHRAAARLNKDEGCVPEFLSCGNGRQFYLPFHFVAAKPQPIYSSPSRRLYFHQVSVGMDACDQFIQAHCLSGDIVITRDIVFAEKLCLASLEGLENVENDAVCVIHDRGVEYSRDNVSARRRRRDLAFELRCDDVLPQSGPRSYDAKDLQHFATCFDRCLTKQIQKQKARKFSHTKKTAKKRERLWQI